ncbi:uncharacterized protein LOC120081197 isoform X2 [Benincasa hispida]|uniref:uncharacterized protein LOC120081197 isoform X2 n=1 Tax=Benincasa hispida TaxID=102211 RepID=UPI00190200DA|nr:uncharacterized protein LOC120081197 isoform X2 [Benincasa hispida]
MQTPFIRHAQPFSPVSAATLSHNRCILPPCLRSVQPLVSDGAGLVSSSFWSATIGFADRRCLFLQNLELGLGFWKILGHCYQGRDLSFQPKIFGVE